MFKVFDFCTDEYRAIINLHDSINNEFESIEFNNLNPYRTHPTQNKEYQQYVSY